MATLTIYFVSDGFQCSLTLEAEDAADLLKKLQATTTWLRAQGAQPGEVANNTPSEAASGNGGAPVCPKHGTPMRQSTKGKGWYCPTKILDDDGTGKPVYCKARAQ